MTSIYLYVFEPSLTSGYFWVKKICHGNQGHGNRGHIFFIGHTFISYMRIIFVQKKYLTTNPSFNSESCSLGRISYFCNIPLALWLPQWNSLASGRSGTNFKIVISEHMLRIKLMSTSREIPLWWMHKTLWIISQHLTLVQVMPWDDLESPGNKLLSISCRGSYATL